MPRFTLQRPAWINRRVKQVVVMARDASTSMRGAKAREASAASIELTTELADPSNKDGFLTAVVDFHDRAKVVHSLTPATDLDGNLRAITVGGGGTNITSALQEAHAIVTNPPDGSDFLLPVTILFSDGQHNTGPKPTAIADQLKQHSDLVTVAFGTDADETGLERLATTPQHFYRCRNGAELRKFLAKVGETLTHTMARQQNATVALTEINDYQDQAATVELQ